MNIYIIIAVIMLLTDFLTNLAADTLNLKTLKQGLKLPDEFTGVYDKNSYVKSQKYTADTTKFGILAGTFDFALLLLFLIFGGFDWLDSIVRGFGFGEITTGLLYIGILLLGKSLLRLPFSVYGTFVIEEKYGFNKTTAKTFTADFIKGLVLTAIIGAPLLAAVEWLFLYGGGLSWLYAYLAVTTVSLFLYFLYPILIMPLFNKFTPLANGELKDRITELAGMLSFPFAGIYVMDGSRRSSKSNAFFTGFGKLKRIALFDTLIKNQSVPELVSILAHEIGHYKKKHVIWAFVRMSLFLGFTMFIFSAFLSQPHVVSSLGIAGPSVYTALVLFMILFTLPNKIWYALENSMSRKHEFEADDFAAEHNEPEIMISALKKLSLDNLSNLTPHPFYVFLHYTHPPVLERIRTLRKINPKNQ